MDLMTLGAVCIALFICNLTFLILYLRARQRAKNPRLDMTAQDLLHELSKGRAILKIEVLDPSSLLLWRR